MGDISAIDQQVRSNLELLRNSHMERMTKRDRERWEAEIEKIERKYEEARTTERDSAATKEDKERSKAIADSIAKNLPSMSKGVISAVAAFKKGDAVGGAAAIMDVCAAAAPLIGTLLGAAAGPPGMIAGALFSIIGQVLSCFMPKQPSLKDEIADLLKQLVAEKQLQKLDAIHMSNEVRETMLMDIARELAEPRMLSLLVRRADQAGFDTTTAERPLSGKKIVCVSGSIAAGLAASRYPGCLPILLVDAEGPAGLRAVPAMLADGRADAFFGLDQYNRSLCDSHGNLIVADVHTPPGVLPSILEMPLTTVNEGNVVYTRLQDFMKTVERAQAKVDIAEFANWEVAAWLEDKKNQDHALWPKILLVWCRDYSDRVSLNTKFNCMIDPALLDDLVKFTNPKPPKEHGRFAKENDPACHLPDETKHDIHKQLLDIQAFALTFRRETMASNKVACEVLEAIMPAIQSWGTFGCIGLGDAIYFRVKPNSSWVAQPGSSDFRRMVMVPTESRPSIVQPSASAEYGRRYHALAMQTQQQNAALYHCHVGADTLDIQDFKAVLPKSGFLDICAAQLADRLDCWAVQGGADGINTLSFDETSLSMVGSPDSWSVDRAKVASVAATYATPDSLLPDDPDARELGGGATWFNPGALGYGALVYGGLRACADLHVHVGHTPRYVPSPWADYTGIATDDRYVWVFRNNAIACATHASIVSCIYRKRQAPRWMQYTLPTALLGHFLNDRNGSKLAVDQTPMDGTNGGDVPWCIRSESSGVDYYGPMPALKGLVSLAACVDGSLTVIVVDRQAQYLRPPPLYPFVVNGKYVTEPLYLATERSSFYTIGHRIDVARQTLDVHGEWTPYIDGRKDNSPPDPNFDFRKVPISFWPMISGLRKKLVAA